VWRPTAVRSPTTMSSKYLTGALRLRDV
jgi:hypothetical protein